MNTLDFYIISSYTIISTLSIRVLDLNGVNVINGNKQFKAESKRLLEMMINSIYTHKEIFIRS